MNRVLLVALVALLRAPPAAEARGTNVLFLIVDDLTATLGCYGDRDAQTPHMDALAARGVRFDRAYTQFALCNPSRGSFLTGCYPERTGVMDLTASLRTGLPDAVTLPQLFKNAGYAAGRIGKVFHVPDPMTRLDVEVGAALHKDGRILDEANLADRPMQAGRVQRMRARLADHMRTGSSSSRGTREAAGAAGPGESEGKGAMP